VSKKNQRDHATVAEGEDLDLPDASRSGRQTQRTTGVDRHVGARIRERRTMMGLSQQQLARIIGVTYQQAHKYEPGLNRVSAGRLFEISQALAVQPSWFFEGLGEHGVSKLSPHQRMCLDLARNFALIENETHRDAQSHMARFMATHS
jgi:transcriptional regulator with XRE-family HTH domain